MELLHQARSNSYPLCSGPQRPNSNSTKWAWHALGSRIVSPQRAQGRCFLDLRLPEAEEAFFTGQALYEERSSTAKGATVGPMLRRRRSCRKKRLSAEAVCIRWPKVPFHKASVLQTDLKIE